MTQQQRSPEAEACAALSELSFRISKYKVREIQAISLSAKVHGEIIKLTDEYIAKIKASSRPARILIDTTNCFDDLVHSSTPWKIYRQDAGMGEHDYAVFLNDVFFCRTEHAQTAHEIIRAMKHRP